MLPMSHITPRRILKNHRVCFRIIFFFKSFRKLVCQAQVSKLVCFTTIPYCVLYLVASPTTANKDGGEKVEVLLKPVGDAPTLKNRKWTIPGDWSVRKVSDTVRSMLKLEAHESLVCCYRLYLRFFSLFTTLNYFTSEQSAHSFYTLHKRLRQLPTLRLERSFK